MAEKRPIGVYLEESEIAELGRIAQETGVKRGALLRYAVRWFMKQYKAGKIKTETKVTKTLPDLD